jgi:hypothetical protein
MFHLDNNSGIDVMPAIKQALSHQSKWFTEGDAQTPPSYPGQDWFNIIQAEILNVLNEANIQPEKTKLNQLTAAIKCIINNNTKEFLPLSGGQLAGDLIIDKQNAGIKLSTNDTNYTLSTSASGDAFSFYFPDAENNYTQRLTYTKQDKTFNFKNCDMKINDSDVITSKNIKSHVGSGKIIAWGRFDYFTNSSIKIIASQGVSAITRNAVGRYTITLSESIDDMKYVVTCNSQQNKREDECFANTCVPMRLKENQFEIWCTDNQQDKFFDTSNCYFIVVVNNN